MPSSIPYTHPSLVLGNIVSPAIVSQLMQIGSLQSRIDAAQDKMNSFIAMKRSLEMTVNELLNMNVDVSPITDRIGEVDKEITTAASDYITVRLSNEAAIQTLKEAISQQEGGTSLESPVDFARSKILTLPLSADSLHLDAQYFSYDENQESNPLNTVNQIESYLKAATGSLGTQASSDVSNKAMSQISVQRKNHQLSGTLIITATCTHKKTKILDPCILDVDRAIEVWNASYPHDSIDITAPAIPAGNAGAAEAGGISILSGAALGSCFIGMVHMLKNDAVGSSGDALTNLASKLQDRFRIGNWFEEASGGFGVDPSMAGEIKSLLSTQTLTTHVNLVTLGAIPSIGSNLVQMGVKTFANIDPEKLNASLANATTAEKSTIDQSANAAKTGARALAIQGATIRSVMMGLGNIDRGANNKVMDIASLMAAFENYLQKIDTGEAGVPISFYVKTITKIHLLKLWKEKYYPETPAKPDEEKDDSKSSGGFPFK
jgi:hypothetical protein